VDPAGLLYVLPTFLGRSALVESPWIGGAQLASAVGDRLGGADMLTPLGLLTPGDVARLSVLSVTQPSAARSVVRSLPQPVKTAVTEARRWDRARRVRTLATRTATRPYRLVIQLHSRHHDAGLMVARRLDVPFVLRLEGLELRENVAWGMRRPVWGGLAERWGELRVIRHADLVATVSEVLDGQLAAAGIEERRRVVVPNGVDLNAFRPGEADEGLRRAHGLYGRFVAGWVGGFRPFHGLSAIPAIAHRLRAEVPGAVVCLVGTGQERDRIAALTKGMEDVVRMPGPVAHADVPRWIQSFDACLMLARPGDDHYSPLKLYEYMACGRPIVASAVGQVTSVITDGRNGLLVPPGNAEAVVDAVARLDRDPAFATGLGEEARRTAEREASWESRAEALLRALENRGLLASADATRTARP